MKNEITQRLNNIDLDEMNRLTRQTRQILLRSYLRRHIPVPFWVVKPERDETARNGHRIARSAKSGA